jgi:hypothetical protein
VGKNSGVFQGGGPIEKTRTVVRILGIKGVEED